MVSDFFWAVPGIVVFGPWISRFLVIGLGFFFWRGSRGFGLWSRVFFGFWSLVSVFFVARSPGFWSLVPVFFWSLVFGLGLFCGAVPWVLVFGAGASRFLVFGLGGFFLAWLPEFWSLVLGFLGFWSSVSVFFLAQFPGSWSLVPGLLGFWS